MNLYNIQQSYLALADQLTYDEVTPELEAQLAITEKQMEEKGRAYGYVCLSFESDIEQIDAELKRLSALKKSRQNAVDRLKSTLSQAMQLFGINEIKTPTLKVSFRKSKSIEIDANFSDEKYMTIKTTTSPDKVKIKYYIEQGETIVGARQVENLNLQIK